MLVDDQGVECRELTTRKRKLALLTLLAVSRRPWTRDALVELFWGEQNEARARHSLSDSLSHLRRVLGPEAITQRRTEVVLGDEIALDVDVLELQEAARAQSWESVVAHYGGPFLEGVHLGGSPRLEQWVDGERRRLDGVFATAARAECDRLLRDGLAAECADLARRWLVVAPLSPHAAVFRLRALAAAGTPESDQLALDDYAAHARQLQRDYDRRPDQMVAAVADEIATRVQARQAIESARPVVTAPVATAPVVIAPSAAPSSTHTSSTMRPRRAMLAVAAVAIVAMVGAMTRERQPTPPALTASPAAQALYERAVVAYDRDGNSDDAVRLLDSAIVLDSTFAMAYRRLGLIYDNGVDGRSRSVQMLTLAARYADRLPEDERLVTTGSYHRTVTGNYARAASAYRALLELSPRNARAWGSLGTVYDYLGDRARAVDAYERSLALDPKHALTWMNVADARYALGDSAGAWRSLDSMALVFPGHPGLFMRTAALAHAENRRELTESQLRALIGSAVDNPYQQAAGEMLLAKAYWSWGRTDDGDAARARAVALDRQRGARDAALVGELELAMSAVWLRGDSARARAQIAAAFRRTPLASLPVDDRPYLDAVIALASAGVHSDASRLLDEYVQHADSLLRRRNRSREHHARGMVALAAQRYARAVAEFRQAADPLCSICGLPELSLSFARNGQTDSARVTYNRYESVRSQRRLDMTAAFHQAQLATRLGMAAAR